MSSSVQRKRRSTQSPPVSRHNAKSRRAASTRRTANADSDPTPPTETIDVMDGVFRPDLTHLDTLNLSANQRAASFRGEEEVVVDLTCESGAEAAVVDLTTNNDSVLLVDEGSQNWRPPVQSYLVSSDEDEDTPPVLSATLLPPTNTSRSTPGTISCPVCLDGYSEIVGSSRLVVSTRCGHVFCSQCLRDSLTSSHTCPTCRKRLTHRQYHPLYI
ncbi:RING finger protein 4 isoform X1 [Neolamprologus brichardi]|uniref:RING finger protein 4 isoform X1 n=1 Tax=Neolamprologus brichardi TaxID=32507 RepID=UPI0003EBEE93|nr:RING finger protein 4 isoform X1 [Neolamprologus brichardi]XP_006781981.1 RING finger protein 4 isoform X1 [Neolamprologus brichardi]